jgi:hypothetical protein
MTRPSFLRWPWVLGTLAGVVLVVSAFQGAPTLVSPEALTFAVIGAIGLFILRAVQLVTKKATTAFEQFSELMGVLYGPKDGNGVRKNDGYLAKIDRISVTCERIPELEEQVHELGEKIDSVAVQASTAADAVRQLQRTVNGLMPPRGAST